MSALLYFALWAGLIFVIMRFGCGAHVMGHGHGAHDGRRDGTAAGGGSRPSAPPEMDIDPVCGMSVRTEGAKSSAYRGKVYYFCSAEHRDTFETAPERYAGPQAGVPAKSVEHHHDRASA
ncbi:MAG: YHS domain-containing protein [Alphaproteobacteria bacterium]|nr:YHS domain-containing protein [Alphaproteobacteria bacterium]